VEETVTITKKDYDNLVEADRFLKCLESVGVDGWYGYELAQDLLEEMDDQVNKVVAQLEAGDFDVVTEYED
jgi:hypothetical protein